MSASSTPAPWRTLAWVALPPLAVLLLRAWLQAQADAGAASLQPLQAATQVSSASEALWMAARPFVLTLAVAGGLAAALFWGGRAACRRWGWARLRPVALAGWLLLCLAAAAALAASHLNRAGRQAQPVQTAQVLLVRDVPPSARGPGGAELYLSLAGHAQPMRLHAEGRHAAEFPPGATVRLQPQAGRWWGRWAALADGA
ncbi:MAG: hypothetical protein Q4D74_10945 [Comamonadaceae bacterium]|nr:hypothetical protein [Comamonadaceae bacterium]